MLETLCSSSCMYLGWVLKNLRSSGTLACKNLNLHIIPFILFAALVGCSSSDSGSNLLPFNSFTPNSPPEFAIEIEGINPDEGIYYSKNSLPAFKFSNVKDGALVSLHVMEECAGESVSSDSTPADGQVSVGLKNSITADGEYTYYAKHANGVEVFDCLEIKYHLDTLAPAEPAIAFADGTTSPSNNTNLSFLISSIEIGAIVSLHTDSACSAEAVALGTATDNTITLSIVLSGDGQYSYYAKQVDRASNASDCSSADVYELYSLLAPRIAFVEGTANPSANLTPSFVVSGVEDGASVSLYTDSECLEANKMGSGTASGDSITLVSTELSSGGEYTYYAKQVDRLENSSDCSSVGVEYNLDIEATAPTIGLARGSSSPSSNLTPSFVVSGVEDGALVSLHTDSACTSEAVKSGRASGNSITLKLQTALSINRTYTYYAKQVDKVSNTSPCSNGIRYTLDTMVVAPTLSLVTSSSFDNRIPIFSLRNLEIGGILGLYSDDNCGLWIQSFSGITAESMEIDLHRPLFNYGIYTYSARQTDSSGNVSDCSSAISYEFFAPFESVWRVGNSEYGDGDRSVTLPLRESDGDGNNFDYDFIVDWGDDSDEQAVTVYSDDVTHTYADAGDYTIKIKGILPTWYFNNGGDKNKIIEVKNLGEVGWKNLDSAFMGCKKLTEFTTGTTDTSQVTNMYAMNASGLESLDLSNWDTSNVIDMDYMFYSTLSLRSLNLSGWITSRVTTMEYMFLKTPSLTSLDVSSFDTSSVESMRDMFRATSIEALDLSNFNTSNVIDMRYMFLDASHLTLLDLSGWTISSSTKYAGIFTRANASLALTCSEGVINILGKGCATGN